MKTPLTAARLKQHITYSWWKYALLIILGIVTWSLIFSVTAYRTPDDKKIEVYIYAYGDGAALDEWLEQQRQTVLTDQEEMISVYVYPDESSGVMVFSTRIMAGEGDLIILPRDEYNSYASQGLFIPLEEMTAVTAWCEAADVNLERSWRRLEETGEQHLYGIPTYYLPILNNAVYSTGNYYVGIRVQNGNEANCIRLLGLLLRESNPEAAEAAGVDALINWAAPEEATP